MSRKLARTNPALAAAIPAVPPGGGGELNRLFGTSRDFPELIEVDVDQLYPNPDQPRRHFDQAALKELAESIAAQGLLQPILVKRRAEGGYLIAAGERRWRAHRLLGKPTIFAVVTTGGIEEVALIENLQRRDLDALEISLGLARLAERHSYTRDQLAGAVGLSKSEVSRLLSLSGLPARIREEYAAFRDKVTKSHMFLLADADGDVARLALWARIKDGATIKELRAAKDAPAEKPAPAPAAARISQAIERFERDLGAFRPGRDRLDAAQKDRLRSLRDRIDLMLG